MADSVKLSRPCHKAFNFDLVIAKLKLNYAGGHYTKAYRDIKAFMRENGIEHRQGSGYRSGAPLTDADVLDIIDKLYSQFPWFAGCVNKFDVTDVGEVYDLAKLFEITLPDIDIDPDPER